MKISRTGATADHGARSVNLPFPKVAWNNPDRTLRVHHAAAKDFTTSVNHRYEIEISESEFSTVLAAYAKAAMSDPASFEAALPF